MSVQSGPSCDKENLNRIFKLQKRAARVISNANNQASSIKTQQSQHSRVTRYSNINFICPKFNRVTEGGRWFAVSTCQLWNSLSLELRNAVSLESYKNNYRNILFKEQQELHHFIV